LICAFAVALAITLLGCGGAVSNNPSAQATSSSSTSTPASAPTILNITDASSTNSNPNCAATWLASLQQIAEPSAGQTINGIQIVSWNDYESSQQIEAGIDNTLSWQVTGNTATIDHYAVFTSTDGTTLMPIGSVPPTTTNFNLTTANLSPANYAVFIQAVGKPSVLNKISPTILYAAKQPPTVAVSVSPTSGSAPLAVNASITSSAATGSVISSNSINFGDGTVVNAATATHTYSASGTYTVTATATDNNNLSSTATATVTVAATLQPPTAKLTVTPTSGTAPLAVSASTAGSTDPNTGGSITSTTINFGDGTVVNTATASHTYSAAGTYTVTAKVTDNNNLSSTATATVTVAATLQPPTAKLTVTPTSGTAPLAVSASTAGSTDPNTGGSITSTTINFGDGTVVNAATASHTYSAAGTYTVTATVTDNNNLSSTVTVTVVVAAPAPPPPAGQTTVTLGGVGYTTTAHPKIMLNPSLITSLQNTSSTGKANAANPPFSAMQTAVQAFIAKGYNWPDGSYIVGPNREVWQYCLNSALLWVAQGSPSGDPNGYLAFAEYCINHAEEFLGGTTGCDQTKSYCGRSGASADYSDNWLWRIAQTYSIVRSQLNGTQIQTFANKVLNDNSNTTNGLGGTAADQTVNCTKQPFVNQTGATFSATTGSKTVTVTGSLTSSIVQGWMISMPNDNYVDVIGVVNTIVGGTITLYDNAQLSVSTITNSPFYASPPWNNNCGIIWYLKNTPQAPMHLLPSQWSHYTTDYPTPSAASVGNLSNLDWEASLGYFAVALALADDDVRARNLATQVYDNVMMSTGSDGQVQDFLSRYTGFSTLGSGYHPGRQVTSLPRTQIILNNSLVSGPQLFGSYWPKRQADEMIYISLPYIPKDGPVWMSPYDSTYTNFQSAIGLAAPELTYLLNGTNEGNYLNWYMLQTTANGGRGDYSTGTTLNGAAYAAHAFIFQTPPAAYNQVDYRSALTTQYRFTQTDYAHCVSLGLTCAANEPMEMMISKSDWTSTATMMIIPSGFWEWGDHIEAMNTGAYHIYRNTPLMMGDSSGGVSGLVVGNLQSSIRQDNTLEIGTYTNTGINAGANGYSMPATTLRWAATSHATPDNVAVGDTQSRYSYALLDLSPMFISGTNLTRAQRHVLHFKKASTQDYLISYDDIATSSSESLKAYFHYYTGCSNANGTVSGASGGAITLTTASSRLLSMFLPVAGTNTTAVVYDGNGYPNNSGGCGGSTGFTYRVTVGPSTDGSTINTSATSGEWLVVHKPSSSTSDTMPTITQPACSGTGGNCTAVQLADSSSPKVAVFARQGVTLTDVSFTSTHSGTAQYVIAGLSPGTYNVTVGGSIVVTGSTVNANDNTLYFESMAGAVLATQTGSSQ
jgi:PKD repeat protein